MMQLNLSAARKVIAIRNTSSLDANLRIWPFDCMRLFLLGLIFCKANLTILSSRQLSGRESHHVMTSLRSTRVYSTNTAFALHCWAPMVCASFSVQEHVQSSPPSSVLMRLTVYGTMYCPSVVGYLFPTCSTVVVHYNTLFGIQYSIPVTSDV